MLHKTVTERILNAFYKVYNILGYGFPEKVYENAMVIELKKHGFFIEQQKKIEVFYDQEIVGTFYSDLVVNDVVVLELKAAESLCEVHRAQLLNYLKAGKHELGLLLNFGEEPEFERVIFSKHRKNSQR